MIVIGFTALNRSSQDYAALQRRLLPYAQTYFRWIIMNERKHKSTHGSGSIEIKLAKEQILILDATMLLGNLCMAQGKLGEAEKM